jgi:beta-N-acetylhexosaminidase
VRAAGVHASTDRETVLNASASHLSEVGRHVIAGYVDSSEIKRLIRLGAVGGIFVTARNAEGKSISGLAAEIASLQDEARRHGRPPLIIAADQEGGIVAQLSPPLRKPPRLARALRNITDVSRRWQIAYRVGLNSGRDLARVGVTLNLAPVADLDFGIRNARDHNSRIGERAISSDPAVVADLSSAYCIGLRAAGVGCTLKHFPGLGRVRGDTHVASARLDTSIETLTRTDWLPFESVLKSGHAAVMVGHVSLEELDAGTPASQSSVVVNGVLRGGWAYDGLVLTDDLTMAAAAPKPGGIGPAAVAALNAGNDLLLVTHAVERVYDVLSALLAARNNGSLSAERLDRSSRRITTFAHEIDMVRSGAVSLP